MPPAGLGLMLLLGLAALSGFAEATVFFIVADVWISWVAVRAGLRTALGAAFAAALGALAGVALLYAWAADDASAALALVDGVPFVTEAMIAGMREDLPASGASAVLTAGVTGVPIKVAAVLAPGAGIGSGTFMAAAFFQRIARFAAVAIIAALLARPLERRTAFALWAAFWLVFYALYWSRLA